MYTKRIRQVPLSKLTRQELMQLLYNQSENIERKNKSIIEKNDVLAAQYTIIKSLRKEVHLYKEVYCKVTKSNPKLC